MKEVPCSDSKFLLNRLLYLQKAQSVQWKMSGGFTFQRNCAIADCSPTIYVTDKEFQRIISWARKEGKS